MNSFFSVTLLIAGIVNFIPVMGILGKSKLESLYGVSISHPETLILMQHRAALFGIIGVYIIYAAFRPHHYVSGASIGSASMLAFIVFASISSHSNALINRVMLIDIFVLALLLIAGVCHFLSAEG